MRSKYVLIKIQRVKETHSGKSLCLELAPKWTEFIPKSSYGGLGKDGLHKVALWWAEKIKIEYYEDK